MISNCIGAINNLSQKFTQKVGGQKFPRTCSFCGVLDTRAKQIEEANKKDCFVKKTPAFNFNECYEKYYNADKINSIINGRIKEICAKNGAVPHVADSVIESFDKGHIKTTYDYAVKIGEKLNLNNTEMKKLKTAAILHDVGKTLIPQEILNKPAALNPQEREIINTHSELGYEILKGLCADEEALDVALNHHKDGDGGKLCDIIKIADRYSALTSERPYKKPFSKEKAFAILDEEVEMGKIKNEYLQALKDMVGFKNPNSTVENAAQV